MAQANRYTVTHRDLALFEACPRLLGVQAYLTTHPAERVSVVRKIEYAEGLDGQAMGSIGEALTAEMLGDLGGEISTEAVTRQAIEALRRRNVVLSEKILQEVQMAVAAAQQQANMIREALTSRYGSLSLLGRGKAHYGHVPGFAAPDFVAVARDSSIILVEAKYQRKLTQEQIRQAEWYNAVSGNASLQVRWIPQAGEAMRGQLKGTFRDPQECVLVNWSPHDPDVIPVTDKANATPQTLREMWRVKLMGAKGKLPPHDCGPSCRCARMMSKHGLNLKEGNQVVIRPAVVAVGEASVEHGVDLERRGLAILADRVGGKRFLGDLRRAHYLGRFTGKPNEAPERLAALLGIDEDRAREILKLGPAVASVPDRKAKVPKAWKPLLKEGVTLQGIKAQVTRTYAAATSADRLVKESGHFWDKAEG